MPERGEFFKTKHAMCHTKTYNSWLAMKQRCYYQKSAMFHLYGGRGIIVCDRWKNSFENFLNDMGIRPNGMTLDRINGDGNYTPENCRWASSFEQGGNTSRVKKVTLNDQSKSISAWCKELGINKEIVYGMIRWRNIDPTEAIKIALCRQ